MTSTQKSWLVPPFLLSASEWLRLDREMSRRPEETDWRSLISIDEDVYDAVSAEARVRGESALTAARRAWMLTKNSDFLVADGGVVAWLERYATGSTGSAVIDGYELFEKTALAARLRSAVDIFLKSGARTPSDARLRLELLNLDDLVGNPYGDGSAGRLRYALLHREEFFQANDPQAL